MRKLLFLLLFSAAITAYPQGTPQDSAWIRENYYKMEQYIPMRDGVKLFTSLYIPKDTTEKHPILMTRTPYYRAAGSPWSTGIPKNLWTSIPPATAISKRRRSGSITMRGIPPGSSCRCCASGARAGCLKMGPRPTDLRSV